MMNRSILILTLAVCSVPVFAQTQKSTAKPVAKTPVKTPAKPTTATFKSNKDSVSYGVGIRIMQSLKAQGFENINLAMLQRAMNDLAQKKTPLLDDAAISQCMNTYMAEVNSVKMAEQQKENAAKSAVNREEGKAFLAVNGKRPGVVTLPSGLQYEVMTQGTGTEQPKLTSRVKCHYTGTLLNGVKFESSVDRGEPINFPLSNVIAGWQEALQLMTVGSKWKLYIPADLAYGDNPRPGGEILPGAALIFEVELLGIEN
jgi:FKBP-type peptidyl-prolyl cis-trans isomerase FklB